VHTAQCRRRPVSFAEITTDKGHDAFLLDEPELIQIVAASSIPRAAARASRGQALEPAMLSRSPPRPDHGESARGPFNARLDHLWVAEDDRAALAARCRLRRRQLLRLLESRGVDGRGIETVREGVIDCVAKGPRGDPGRRRRRPRRLSRRCLRHVVLRRRCRRPAISHRDRALLRIGAMRWCPFPTSATGESGCCCCLGGRMPQTDNLPDTWYDHAEHPFLHHQGLPRPLPHGRRPRWNGHSRSTLGPARLRLNAPWWFWNLFGEQAVSY